MHFRTVLLAAFCWAVFALTPPTTRCACNDATLIEEFAIDQGMFNSDDPWYDKCLQLFLDFATTLANEAYITECHNSSYNITSYCFSEYSSLCGPGLLPDVSTRCEYQLDNHSSSTGSGENFDKKNAGNHSLPRKKAKCIARVLIVMMSNSNVGLCTAVQLCSEGHKAPQCKERYTVFKEALQEFCQFPGLPVVTPTTLRRKTEVVQKCRGDVNKCSSTVKILGGCLAVAGVATLVLLFTFAKKWVASLRERRGRYTLSEYVPPINAATSATRLGPDSRGTPECDEACSFMSHEAASNGKWSEFSSTPKSRQFEPAQEGKPSRHVSLNTTLESSFSEGEVCSSCCNCGSTNPDSSDSKPSALSESELLARRPGRCAEFPNCPVGRGVGSSLGRGYYSESGTARLTVCERSQAWRNMLAHRLLAYPHDSNTLPSKMPARDSSPAKMTGNTCTEKHHAPSCSAARMRSARSEQGDTFGRGEKLTDGTRTKASGLRLKKNAEEQNGPEDRKEGKSGQNGISKGRAVTSEIEKEERGCGFKKPDVDQQQRAEKPGPSRIVLTDVELKEVGRAGSNKNKKISTSMDKIESTITAV